MPAGSWSEPEHPDPILHMRMQAMRHSACVQRVNKHCVQMCEHSRARSPRWRFGGDGGGGDDGGGFGGGVGVAERSGGGAGSGMLHLLDMYGFETLEVRRLCRIAAAAPAGGRRGRWSYLRVRWALRAVPNIQYTLRAILLARRNGVSKLPLLRFLSL